MAGAGNSATISLRLLAQGFTQGLRQAAGQVRQIGQSMGTDLRQPIADGLREGLREGMRGMDEGAGGVRTTLKDKLMPTMQQVAGVAATVGSALSLGAAAQTAIGLRDAYQQVAFKLERLKGTSVDWTEVQGQVETAAEKTSRRVDELTEAYDSMLQQGASAEFAGEGLVTAGHLMNATRMGAAETGQAIAALSGKFGISAKESMAAAEIFAVATGKGQLSMEESMQDLRDFGSTARMAGWSGMEGFRKMMGVVAVAGKSVNSTTSEIQTGLDTVNDKLRDVGALESLLKETNPELQLDKDAWSELDSTTERLQMLAEQGPKAMKAFRQQMSGREEIAISDALMKPYFDTLKDAKKRSLSDSDAAKAAKDKLAEHLNNLGGDIQATGTLLKQSEKVQSGASAKIQKAMNKWLEAISSDKFLAAIDKVVERLPQLADIIAQVVDWAADNPMLAGAAVLGVGGLGGGALLAPMGGGGGGGTGGPVASTVSHGVGSAFGGIATAITTAVAKNVINHLFSRGQPPAPAAPPVPPAAPPAPPGPGPAGPAGGNRTMENVARALILIEMAKLGWTVGTAMVDAVVDPALRQGQKERTDLATAQWDAQQVLNNPNASVTDIANAQKTLSEAQQAKLDQNGTFAGGVKTVYGGIARTFGLVDQSPTQEMNSEADKTAALMTQLTNKTRASAGGDGNGDWRMDLMDLSAASMEVGDANARQAVSAERSARAMERLAAATDKAALPNRSGNATPGAAPR